MYLLQISIETRIIIGIAAMVLLFTSFIIAFVTSQRKKLEYQRTLQIMLEQEQAILSNQNQMLEQKVAERTAELNEQKEALQASLTELKTTQQQLVQREKMASLGEMTAGIAHEIQNPLNFINNFAEVSVEIFEEIEDEIAKGNTEEAEALTLEVKTNLNKIQQHGKRAEAIIKSMMEHSRISVGKMELINLNDLVAESAQLAYHGMLTKEKSLQVSLQKDFEENLPPVNVVPQDLSRVLINLINNALYSVVQKQKKGDIAHYKASVSITTKKAASMISITIRDNGNGIPAASLLKIFQPFFTTKPTGEGTGLGLSMSYDIISKTHGGDLTVESVEGEFAAFTLTLPIR